MNQEEIEKWRLAGKITAQVREHAKKIVVPGASLLKVTEELEQMILDLAAELAFPVTMGLNHIAAHYAADFEDEHIFKDEVIKVDLGAQIDGFIGDTAVTIDLSGKYTDLLQAAQEALNNAIKIVKPGVTLGAIGKVIEDTIVSKGFNPVRNLSGHGIQRYEAHTNPSIPNYDTGSNETLKAGTIIAIEPFATTGNGLIKDSNTATIYEQINSRPVRSPIVRKVFAEIKKFNNLPFNYRWLSPQFSVGQIKLAIKQLMKAGNLRDHTPLPEIAGGMVSQFEHTLLITEEGVEVLTKL